MLEVEKIIADKREGKTLNEHDKIMSEMEFALLDSEDLTGEEKCIVDRLNKDFDNKCVNGWGQYIKTLQESSDSITAEIKRLQERKQVIDNQKKGMENRLLAIMIKHNRKKIKGDFLTLTVLNGRESVQIDESQIDLWKFPRYLLENKPSFNRTMIKDEIKNGKIIPGCSIVIGGNSLKTK